MMEDLEALLEDLEATIPPPITCGPKESVGKKDDIILDMKPELNGELSSDATINQSALHGNLSELDSLLEDLYNTKETTELSQQDATEVALTDSPTVPDATNVIKPSEPESEKVNIDSMLEELDKPDDNADSKSNADDAAKEVNTTNERSQSPVSVLSATQQLDDLMNSLAGFTDEKNTTETNATETDSKVKTLAAMTPVVSSSTDKVQNRSSKNIVNPSNIFSPIPMPANPNDLDVMLQDMNTVLVQQGIVAASKGLCGACKKPVMGEVTTALGQVWHPEHFVCAVCDKEIGTSTFFEREGKPYCEKDYHDLFSPTCAYCNKPVLGQCVTALNNTWHPEHFFCAACNNYFGDEGFHEHDGKPYCRADFYKLFAPQCGSCKKPIISNYISALNAQWHPECFVCRECLAPFTHGSFFELHGLPYCETHYHLLRGSLCAECHKPITGRCITAMGKKFHPEHFICAFCLKQLNKGTFKEQNDKPYCHQCFAKLFGQPGSV